MLIFCKRFCCNDINEILIGLKSIFEKIKFCLKAIWQFVKIQLP